MSGAIAGTFADFKLIRTRDVVQIVIEVPREKADTALAALGGLPKPGAEQWVAMAPLNGAPVEFVPESKSPPAEPLERKPLSLANKVALTCGQLSFSAFLKATFPARWRDSAADAEKSHGPSYSDEQASAFFVREFCQVSSRSQILPGSDAGECWLSLEATYHDWQRRRAA